MPHRQRVQSEFSRQAESFAASPTLSAAELTATAFAALGEARRGRVLDLLSFADPEQAALHNALERLRDPSHVRMLALHELQQAIASAGFELTDTSCWTRPRDYDEWAAIIADPVRMASLRVVMQHLARNGVAAGMALREQDGGLTFSYRWALVSARRHATTPRAVPG